jgi:hypothetical protein
MVSNVTFNNISVTSWRSVLLVEETGLAGENHRPAASYWLYHTLLYRVTPHSSLYTIYIEKGMRSIIKDDITLHVTALTWQQKGLLCKKKTQDRLLTITVKGITSNSHGDTVVSWYLIIRNNPSYSAIYVRSVLLVEETGLAGENHRPAASYWLYHTLLYRVTPHSSLYTIILSDVKVTLDTIILTPYLITKASC